jgi:hypothetical protein
VQKTLNAHEWLTQHAESVACAYAVGLLMLLHSILQVNSLWLWASTVHAVKTGWCNLNGCAAAGYHHVMVCVL